MTNKEPSFVTQCYATYLNEWACFLFGCSTTTTCSAHIHICWCVCTITMPMFICTLMFSTSKLGRRLCPWATVRTIGPATDVGKVFNSVFVSSSGCLSVCWQVHVQVICVWKPGAGAEDAVGTSSGVDVSTTAELGFTCPVWIFVSWTHCSTSSLFLLNVSGKKPLCSVCVHKYAQQWTPNERKRVFLLAWVVLWMGLWVRARVCGYHLKTISSPFFDLAPLTVTCMFMGISR